MTCVIPFSRMIRAMLSLSWTSQYTKLPLTTSSLFSFTSEATTEPGCLSDHPDTRCEQGCTAKDAEQDCDVRFRAADLPFSQQGNQLSPDLPRGTSH